jgi:hypothetical protein
LLIPVLSINSLLGQYYLLKSALQDYRNIEKKGLESYCDTSENENSKLGDTAAVILQIENRLLLAAI